MNQSTKLKLLGRATSANVQKVLWCLDELELDYERVDIGGPFGGNREADYLALNPNGVVPTLVDGDTVVWESNTILRYLCNRQAPTTLYPADAVSRAEIERWMDWQLSTLNLSIAPLFQMLVRMPPEQRDPAVIETHRVRAADSMRILDGVLAGRDWLAGSHLSLADITMCAFAYRWFELPIERPPLPNLSRWYASLSACAGFQRHAAIGLS